MDVQINGITGIKGTISAPPSKSYTHRALIIAGLAQGESEIKNHLESGDTLATIKALEAFGVGFRKYKNKLLVNGSSGILATPKAPIDCENSGTTMRLMSSIATLDGAAVLTGDASLQRRPMQPLLDALGQLGVKAISIKGNGYPPIKIQGGGITGGTAKIRGDVSSQFISSLLISAPYSKRGVAVELTTELKSRPYVDITLETMRAFGVEARNDGYRLIAVDGGQSYKARTYAVEGDYSSASYFLALAALTGSEITAKNLAMDSKQADSAILNILKEMGAEVKAGREKIVVKGGALKGVEVDLSDAPDLLPTIAALACKADGETLIKNVEHARYKESDRISACAREFRKFKVDIREAKDGLTIRGSGELAGAAVESGGDHRMAMALTIAGLAARGTTIVKNAECADISYPGFYDIIASLVGRANIRTY